MANLRVGRALCYNNPPAADVFYKAANIVLVYRENHVNNRTEECLGSSTVVDVDLDRKLIYVHLKNNGLSEAFNIAQVEKFSSYVTDVFVVLL